MLPRIEVNTKEVDDLVKKIAAMGDEAHEWVADEIAYTALMIESDAKKACPVITGRLRASITSMVSRNPIGAVVGTNVEYAPLVEFGSKLLGRRPKPFLGPAYFNRIVELNRKLMDAFNQ